MREGYFLTGIAFACALESARAKELSSCYLGP